VNAIGRAVEEIDRRPQQVLKVGLEACVTERRDQGVEHVGDSAADGAGFREWPRIGLVLERSVSVELERSQYLIRAGRLGSRIVGVVAIGRHGDAPSWDAAAWPAFTAIT
jgi:hypothetical protein